MVAQLDLAANALRSAPRAAGAPDVGTGELRRVFEAVYTEAVAASHEGRSVPSSRQIAIAGERTGRRPEIAAYLRGLGDLVARIPFHGAPGAVEALRDLRASGWRTAIVSNTVGEPGRALRPILRRLGYAGLLDAEVFSDEQPWAKPAPEIFHTALRALGIPPAQAVHVGDGRVDVEGALNAGYRAAVLYTGLQRYGPRYEALFQAKDAPEVTTPYETRSWSEVPGILRGLFGAGSDSRA